MAVNRWIVTTTINPVTDAIKKYDAMPDWNLLVIGDRKTPSDYQLARGVYLSWDYQRTNYPGLCDLVGPDNTQRGRMIAFIEAYRHGAELVATIDDDCDPYPGWPGPIYVGKTLKADCFQCDQIVFDPLTTAGYAHLARGYPPQLKPMPCEIKPRPISPLVQENFWDGEADYDACWRIHGSTFEKCKAKKPFWSDAFSPINTQNLIIHGSVLKDHCGEIPFVGHASDIWAGYLFQAYHPNSTLYCPSNVKHWQERTLESVLKDLDEELYSYRNVLSFVESLKKFGSGGRVSLPDESVKAISLYRRYFE
jgi:hypothetical protein